MKIKPLPLLLLLLVSGIPPVQAMRPCTVGESEDDIFVTIYRMGYYRQGADGVVPEARDHSVGDGGPSPLVVEVFEEGLTGFTVDNSTFDGMIQFDWGEISFEEGAIFWTGTSFGFASENAMTAAVSGSFPEFRFLDEGAAFTANLPVAAWDLPTPQVTNFEELQEIDPAEPVTLRWNPLVGNAAAEISILQVREYTGLGFRTVFTTIPCPLPFPLPGVAVMEPSATSFTLPANLLTNRNATYAAELMVSRYHGSRSGDFGASWRVDASDEKRTAIPLRIGSGSPPRFVTATPHMTRGAGGALVLTAMPEETGLLKLDSSLDLKSWSPWRTNAVVAGVAVALPVEAGESARYIRVATP